MSDATVRAPAPGQRTPLLRALDLRVVKVKSLSWFSIRLVRGDENHEACLRGTVMTAAASLLAGSTLLAQQRGASAERQTGSPLPLGQGKHHERSLPMCGLSLTTMCQLFNVGIVVSNALTLMVDPGMGVRNGQAVLRGWPRSTERRDV
jgi:hypothetical protein